MKREKKTGWYASKSTREDILRTVAERKRKEAEFAGDYKYLGWENAWLSGKTDLCRGRAQTNLCRNLGHKLERISLSNRGTHEVFKCAICKIYWNLDCGD